MIDPDGVSFQGIFQRFEDRYGTHTAADDSIEGMPGETNDPGNGLGHNTT